MYVLTLNKFTNVTNTVHWMCECVHVRKQKESTYNQNQNPNLVLRAEPLYGVYQG